MKEQWFALGDSEAAERFARRITVPVCRHSESPHPTTAQRGPIGWYRRRVRIPESFAGRHVWLCFGGVHGETIVWVNGHEAGQHSGGFEPFDLDLTPFAKPGSEAVIVVRVADFAACQENGGPAASARLPIDRAIWQPVYLEARPELFVASVQLRSVRWAEAWHLEVDLELVGPEDEAVVQLSSPDDGVRARCVRLRLHGGRGRRTYALQIDNPRPWSPDDPHLYELTISAQPARCPANAPSKDPSGPRGAANPAHTPKTATSEPASVDQDVVHSYFGLRTIEVATPPGAERPMVLLNGRPIYLRGVVAGPPASQGPCTTEGEELLRRKIASARAAGFNLLRLQEPAEPRLLYWADRLGMLVWQQLPDRSEGVQLSRTEWEQAARALLRRDINHPSVIVWGLCYEDQMLGENWQEDASACKWLYQMVRRVKRQDPSRLVVDRLSARPAHLAGDLRTWRFSTDDLELLRRHLDFVTTRAARQPEFGCLSGSLAAGAPLVCGQAGLLTPNGGRSDSSLAFRHLITLLRRREGLQGYVYWPLSDSGDDHRGLLSPQGYLKQPGYAAFVADMQPADLQGPDFVGYEGPPVIEAAPGEQFHLPVFVSHYSQLKEAPDLVWYVVGVDDLGREVLSQTSRRRVVWEPFAVRFQPPIKVTVPSDRLLVGAIGLELRNRTGRRLAANYVNLIVRRELPLEGGEYPEDDLPGMEILGRRLAALRFHPGDLAAARGATAQAVPLDEMVSFRGDSISAAGPCELEYHLAIPPAVRDAVPGRIMLLAEVAAAQPDPPGAASNSPQAQADAGSSSNCQGRLVIELAGCTRTCPLPGVRADARGVLNWQSAADYCAYGHLLREVFDAREDARLQKALERASELKLVFRVEQCPGLRLFGVHSGRYPIAPTLLVETAMDIRRPTGVLRRGSAAIDRLEPDAAEPALDGGLESDVE